MTAADDARGCVKRTATCPERDRAAYLTQAQVHALLAIAESLQRLADEVAALTVGGD